MAAAIAAASPSTGSRASTAPSASAAVTAVTASLTAAASSASVCVVSLGSSESVTHPFQIWEGWVDLWLRSHVTPIVIRLKRAEFDDGEFSLWW